MLYRESLRTSKAVLYLLIISLSVFVVQNIPVFGKWIENFGYLQPSLVMPGGQIWRLGTYLFLHGDLIHILFNMIGLWMFGVELEDMWGTRRFVYFYLITGIGSGILSLFMVFLGDNPIIGASGAIYAILFTYAYYFPNRQVLLFFIIPVPVWLIVLLMIFISLAGFLQMAGGISHITHLGGILLAFLYIRYYDYAINWNTHRKAVKAEKTMRQNTERKIRKDRYFEEVIDPILKKISEQGMDSLTKEEKRKLDEASKNNK